MKKAHKAPRSILTIVFLCLLASGLIRVGSAGVAIANANTDIDNAATGEPSFDEKTDELSILMQDLAARGIALDAREEELNTLEQELETARQRILEELDRLEASEKSLAKTIQRVESAAQDDVTNLVSVYEAMKPKEAALLFEQMEPEFAAGFLAQMAPSLAAGIMSGLTSEKAYEISVVLAGRNAK